MVTSPIGNNSALLAFCAGNSLVTSEFPSKRPVPLCVLFFKSWSINSAFTMIQFFSGHELVLQYILILLSGYVYALQKNKHVKASGSVKYVIVTSANSIFTEKLILLRIWKLDEQRLRMIHICVYMTLSWPYNMHIMDLSWARFRPDIRLIYSSGFCL